MSVPEVDRSAATMRDTTAGKPLPHERQEAQLPPPPFEDTPILTEPMPEQSAFVDTYNRVGKPRIAVSVDRSTVPADDAFAQSYDDEAIREELVDWLGCNGQVTMVTPSDAKNANADQAPDVIVRLQAHPTRQYQDGVRIRLLAEATNTRDGVSIGRAFVDIPPPLEKTQINRYTRWLARKLMDDMTAAWLQPDPQNQQATSAPPATSPPPTRHRRRRRGVEWQNPKSERRNSKQIRMKKSKAPGKMGHRGTEDTENRNEKITVTCLCVYSLCPP